MCNKIIISSLAFISVFALTVNAQNCIEYPDIDGATCDACAALGAQFSCCIKATQPQQPEEGGGGGGGMI